MGIRSDVFVGIKRAAHDSMPQKFKTMLTDSFGATVRTHDEGVAYSMDDVKWYHDTDAELVEFYGWLREFYDQHVVIAACHDYPESSDADSGDWHDSPWEPRRCVSVSIEFAEVGYGDEA